uniref:Extensin n=1 Tax=Rhabditophanes sp. KR3021 TaxID=114890 RepID=A0AC35TZL9_9BILA
MQAGSAAPVGTASQVRITANQIKDIPGLSLLKGHRLPPGTVIQKRGQSIKVVFPKFAPPMNDNLQGVSDRRPNGQFRGGNDRSLMQQMQPGPLRAQSIEPSFNRQPRINNQGSFNRGPRINTGSSDRQQRLNAERQQRINAERQQAFERQQQFERQQFEKQQPPPFVRKPPPVERQSKINNGFTNQNAPPSLRPRTRRPQPFAPVFKISPEVQTPAPRRPTPDPAKQTSITQQGNIPRISPPSIRPSPVSRPTAVRTSPEIELNSISVNTPLPPAPQKVPAVHALVGPPAESPPDNFVVNELNNSVDFLATARRLAIARKLRTM